VGSVNCKSLKAVSRGLTPIHIVKIKENNLESITCFSFR